MPRPAVPCPVPHTRAAVTVGPVGAYPGSVGDPDRSTIMTRVAILPSSYPPSLGGVEELTRHLALSLVDAGDQVEVWTGHPDDATPETVEILDGIVVRRLPMPLPATNWSAIRRSAVTGTRTLFSLRSAVAAFRPDLLHVQCFGPNGAYAHALSRVSGLPLVVTLQGETLMDDTDIFDVSRVLRSSLRSSLRSAAAVTGCSAFTLADAEDRFGLAPGRGQVIPNGVDLGGGAGTEGHLERPRRQRIGLDGRMARGSIARSAGLRHRGGSPGPSLHPGPRPGGGEEGVRSAAWPPMPPSTTPDRTADLVIGGQGEALDDLRRTASALGRRRPGPLRGPAVPPAGGRSHGRGDDVRHAQPARAVRDRDPRSVAGRDPGGGHQSGRASRVRPRRP